MTPFGAKRSPAAGPSDDCFGHEAVVRYRGAGWIANGANRSALSGEAGADRDDKARCVFRSGRRSVQGSHAYACSSPARGFWTRQRLWHSPVTPLLQLFPPLFLQL